jgi:hypothetical protein
MDSRLAIWAVVAPLALAAIAALAVWIVRQRASPALSREKRLQQANRAIRQIARENRQIRRGGLRGKGGGGDYTRAQDASTVGDGGVL